MWRLGQSAGGVIGQISVDKVDAHGLRCREQTTIGKPSAGDISFAFHINLQKSDFGSSNRDRIGGIGLAAGL